MGYDPGRASLRSWLYGIATNLLHNQWRAEQHLLQLDARLSSDAELRQDLDLSDDRLSASLVAPKLASALSELVAERRDVFLLYVWADLSPREIGEALGIPDGTVRSRLSRARAELRERLGNFDFDLWVFEETPSTSPQGSRDD
jgi:RNA polymerase sigma-70 factor (ECF subfamily)